MPTPEDINKMIDTIIATLTKASDEQRCQRVAHAINHAPPKGSNTADIILALCASLAAEIADSTTVEEGGIDDNLMCAAVGTLVLRMTKSARADTRARQVPGTKSRH